MKSVSLKNLRLLFPILFILFLSIVLGIAVWQLMLYRSSCRDMDEAEKAVQKQIDELHETHGRAVRLLVAMNSRSTLTTEDLEEYEFRTAALEKAVAELQREHPSDGNMNTMNFYAARVSMDARLCRSLSGFAHDPSTEEEMRKLLQNAQVHLNFVGDALHGWQKVTVDANMMRNQRKVTFVTHLFRFMLFAFAFAAALYLIAQMVITVITKKALYSLGEGTRKFRDGQLDFRFENIAADEIGSVKFDFNLMAHQLEKQANELRRANEELRMQAEKLIEAHQHKDKFLANMSHELRTPLNSIICFTELIRDRAGKLNTEKEIAYAEKILAAAEHLLSLITSLLDLAKCGAGTLTPSPENFSLSDAVVEMCDLLAPLAKKKNLSCDCSVEGGICVCADRRMVQQIFMNLFSNAVKYTIQGGVNICLHKVEQDGKSMAVLDIRDTGIGIAEAEQEKLFQDFYRVESAAKIAVDGIGIGLALSRRMAKMNNGEITFVSCDRQGESGSTFTLTLPINDKCEETPEE